MPALALLMYNVVSQEQWYTLIRVWGRYVTKVHNFLLFIVDDYLTALGENSYNLA